MPNFVMTEVDFCGTSSELFEQIKTDIGDSDQLFDFNRLIPMPEQLFHVDDCTKTRDALLMYKLAQVDDRIEERIDEAQTKQLAWWLNWKNLETFSRGTLEEFLQSKTGQELYEIGRKANANIENYGAMTWRDWQVQHWGVQGNASQVTLEGRVFRFQTPWDSPTPLARQLAERYPACSFRWEFVDEGENFGGYISYVDGVFDDKEASRFSLRFDKHACYLRLWGE